MPRFNPTLLCLWLLSAAGLFAVGQVAQPNILMILVDDLGYGDLSCQGAEDLQTPAIDRLFASGMTFENFYANCTVCSPSRAAFLTGRYPDAVGVPGVVRQDPNDTWGFLDPEVETVADVLAAAGYATALIGKWHLGLESPNLPNERGFEYFRGFLGDMMDDYWSHLRGGINWMRHNGEVIEPTGHATDLFAEWAVEYLQSRVETAEPFFLFLSLNAPHDPVQPPRDWLQRVREREPGLTPKRARLVAFVEHMDAGIGKVLQQLERSGLAQDTLVVFASDNGGALRFGANNGRLRGGKGDHFEGGIRVPMAATWPGHIPSDSRSQNVALLMDLLPTLCELAAAQQPDLLDGLSLLPTLMGHEQVTNDRVLFWVRQEGNPRFGGHTYYAARYKNHKLLQNSPWEPYQYYDLAADPYERAPLQPTGATYSFLFNQLTEHIQRTTVPRRQLAKPL